MENSLTAVQRYGQSLWLDYIRRNLITSGELQRLIDEDGLRGLTSNPAIFEKAIAGSSDYHDLLSAADSRKLSAQALYERIAVRDIQEAARLLLPVYERTARRDGYVSLEVSPNLACDTPGTLVEARRLWKSVSMPNAMIKVPGTAAGIPAVQQLISEGINVNVTLLFSQSVYERVAEAFITGLEQRAAGNEPLAGIASVASFFISRIDGAVDALLDSRLSAATSATEQGLLRDLRGQVAVANAKLVYQRYLELCKGPRWRALADRGAQTQRLLWASTGTKDPSYRDVRYIEALIGPDTVNTVPPATLDAFRDHGQPHAGLCEDVEDAFDTMAALVALGISMEQITSELLEQGVRMFSESFDKLLRAVGQHAGRTRAGRINELTCTLPGEMKRDLNKQVEDWRAQAKVRRLWAHDASLWTGKDEGQWLGWLDVANDQLAHIERLKSIAETARQAGFTHALLLGMGGSSLGPEVMKMTFGRMAGFPELHVLDSTDPAQVAAVEARIDIDRTVFIVSSKSGGTLEPNIFEQYFFERVKQRVGEPEAARRFIAITDPGSHLHHLAESEGFRHVFFGKSSVGGRYSVLSDFGLVPAAIMGIDVPRFLDRTEEMVQACMPSVPVEENPGVMLGLVLGVAHNHGHDKLTLITSPAIADLGAWLEQLVGESTGKNGKGIIPVDRESLSAATAYDDDRVFVYTRLESAPDPAQDAAVETFANAGHPVVRINVKDIYDLGGEFYRWEIATAVAGAVIGVHPFDQPDVEASKVATRRLTEQFERLGTLPPQSPLLEENGLRLFADEDYAASLKDAAGGSIADYIRAHLNRIVRRDYFALLAYIEMNASNEAALQRIRHTVRDGKHVATCLGFGPRFLHSTGQAYKGGPNSGVFLQITADDALDLPVPQHTYTFGVVKAAQARGDFQVLADRHRRALRIDLGQDLAGGLAKLDAVAREAFA